MREVVLNLVTMRMMDLQTLAKDTGKIDDEEYLILYQLFLELAPDEAIEKVMAEFEKQGLLNFKPATFSA